MKCNYCGNELEPGSKFCDACGSPVGEQKIPTASDGIARPSEAATILEVDASPVASPDPAAAQQVAPQPVVTPQAVVPPPSMPAYQSFTPAASGFQSVEEPKKFLGMDANTLAIIGLVAGIVSLCAGIIPCIGFPIPIIGGIAGFMGMKSERKVLAIVGLALSVLGLIINIIATVCGGFSLFNLSSQGSGGYYY